MPRFTFLNPGYATAHQWHAEYLAAIGELDRAEEEIRIEPGVDPLRGDPRFDEL